MTGSVGIVAVNDQLAQLEEAVTATQPVDGETPTDRGHITVASPRQIKGMEFDHVVILDPERIVAESASGRRLLYVAMTRCTKSVVIVYRNLPTGLQCGTTANEQTGAAASDDDLPEWVPLIGMLTNADRELVELMVRRLTDPSRR